MKKDIAAGAFSSDQQVGIMNSSTQLQVRARFPFRQASTLYFMKLTDGSSGVSGRFWRLKLSSIRGHCTDIGSAAVTNEYQKADRSQAI